MFATNLNIYGTFINEVISCRASLTRPRLAVNLSRAFLLRKCALWSCAIMLSHVILSWLGLYFIFWLWLNITHYFRSNLIEFPNKLTSEQLSLNVHYLLQCPALLTDSKLQVHHTAVINNCLKKFRWNAINISTRLAESQPNEGYKTTKNVTFLQNNCQKPRHEYSNVLKFAIRHSEHSPANPWDHKNNIVCEIQDLLF